ncbi:MAG: hypothetical protein ABSF94_14295 [Steroidobacteraceae bacterium]
MSPSRLFLSTLLCLSAWIPIASATGVADSTPVAPAPSKSQAALLAETLSALNLSSPISDLDASWDRKDLRFVGVNSYTCMAPGVGGLETELPQQYGLRCLFGTSDFIESREHAALMRAALRYAARYNAELARRILRNR